MQFTVASMGVHPVMPALHVVIGSNRRAEDGPRIYIPHADDSHVAST